MELNSLVSHGNWIKGVNDYWKHLNFSVFVSDFRHGCYNAV